jgi:hypothetical protein
MFLFRLGCRVRLSHRSVGANEMKLKRAVILVCTCIFSAALAAATAQSIAQESPPQTSPDLTAVEKGIKQKSESAGSLKYEAHPESRLPSKSKAPPSRSHAKSESAWSSKHQAHSKARPPSHLKASPSRSHSRTHQRHRSHRHRSSRAGDQPQVAMPFVIVPNAGSDGAICNRSYAGLICSRSYYARLVDMQPLAPTSQRCCVMPRCPE